jgi:hypothetical protein
MLPFLTTQGQTLVEGAAERLRGAIVERWPNWGCWPNRGCEPEASVPRLRSEASISPLRSQAAAHDAALLAECLVRLAISYATLPVAPAGMTASSIAELLGPFIDRALRLELEPPLTRG